MPQWTPDQKAAIEADGGTLLVTAAAGSGKTSVLTQRILRLITEKGIDIDRLLVVTFTRAAAGEMRERIAAGIAEKLAENPTDRNLIRQQMLLGRANISTVHGFCTSFVRENFRAADVDCDFRIMDEGEYGLLKAEVLDGIIESMYALREDGFIQLADILSGNRSDAPLRECVQKLYEFLSSNDDGERWLDVMEKRYYDPDCVNFWGELAKQAALEDMRKCIALVSCAAKRAEEDSSLNDAYSAALADDLRQYEEIADALERGGIEPAAKKSAAFSKTRFKNAPKSADEFLKKRVKDLREKAFAVKQKLDGSLFCYTHERIAEDTEAVRPAVKALVLILRTFRDELTKAKRSANVLSFDDLEQITISLLTERDQSGARVKTPLAEEMSGRFDAILVDEYQDTNPAQAFIFQALSREGENLFMVGDIKQSIYAFRNASAEIFADKKDAYPEYDAGAPKFPARISLSANFRSREGITDFINHIFELICTKEMGGTEYDSCERLYPAGSFPEDGRTSAETELYFLESADTEKADEAGFILRRIKALMEENIRVPSGSGKTRPLSFGDIAVISRSGKELFSRLKKVLCEANIPVCGSEENSFFDIYEVNVAVSVLRVVDNPYQDIPLACVMTSPLFSFTYDELAVIRSENRGLALYPAVKEFARSRSDGKATKFLRTVEELRREASSCPCDVFILKAYARLSLPALLCAGRGPWAKANLDRFVDCAAAFAASGNRSVAAFLRYLDRLDENRCTVKSASADAGNGVKMLTIHGSKGLEFPVVIVAGISKFNTSDSRSRYLVHSKLGFGGSIKRGTAAYSTVQKDIISRRILAEQRSEEVRMLYVALTRAAQKLIVCSSVRGIWKKAAEWSDVVKDGRLLRIGLEGAGSFNDWLLPAACIYPCGAALLSGRVNGSVWGEKDRIFIAASDTPENMPFPLPAASRGVKPESAPEEVQDAGAETNEGFDMGILRWKYPYESGLKIPTKVSATGVSHGDTVKSAYSIKPAFAEKRIKLSGAAAGTAMHKFMKYLEFNSEKSPVQQLEEMRRSGRLTDEEAEAVNITACEKLLAGRLGGRIADCDARGELLREYPFSFRIPAAAFTGMKDSEGSILVSGTADMVLFENGIPVVVDFKTDKTEDVRTLAERYGNQLRLYMFAASELWETGKAEGLIWSFYTGEAIPVEQGDAVLL